MSAKDKIDLTKLPQHVAIIMDGNGRWAKNNLGKSRIFGHRNGVKPVKETVEACGELGIKYLTLYAFSTENWSRPSAEIKSLMSLLVKSIRNETPKLVKNNIRLNAIGDLSKLPGDCQKHLEESMQLTQDNDRLILTLALSYSGRSEITKTMKKIGQKIAQGNINPEDIDEGLIQNHLETNDLPDPELMIRTSGEHRISNFLLWQLAYSELYFTDVLWPNFNREELYEAILNFQQRERRFGKTSEQLV